MSAFEIVYVTFVHVLAGSALILGCLYGLQILELRRRRHIVDVMVASALSSDSPIHHLKISTFDGDVKVLRGNDIYTILVDRTGDPRFDDDGTRDCQEIVVTEWNARRLLVELALMLNLTLTRETRRKIRTETR